MTRHRLAAAVLAAAILTTACSPSSDAFLSGAQEVPVDQLWARPSVDDAAADLDRMLTEVRTRLETDLGLDGWTASSDGGRSGCEITPDPQFERWTLARWKRDGPIPDADWTRALQIVTEVTAPYGFAPPRVIEARPGQYAATAIAPATEAYMRIGSQRFATIGATTGCHPTARALAERAAPPT